jgi:hypothetical protein
MGPSTSVSLPAPVGGWNTRDSIAAMPPTDAPILVNFFPSTTNLPLRFGYTKWATGIPGQVETVMAYSGAGVTKLLAIGGNSVYDVTSGGAVGAAQLSGLTNSRWQYVNISTPGGNYIEMCNGVDSVKLYDGTTWTSPSITGVTSANLTNINVFKNRVWFTEANTLKAWYLPTQSISGAANALDLSAFCPHGGYLVAIGTWTIDAGYGVDDYIVFVTSRGDVLVYRGTDPSSATTWSIVGQYYVGTPVSRRCMTKYAGDLLLLTQDGLSPLSGYLQSSRLDPRVSLTDKIKSTVSNAVSVYGNNFGWGIMPFPKQNMLFLNVPIQTGNNQEQYVMNTITGAWTDFQGWNANCWELYLDDPYFGGNTFVGKAWNTQADNGAAISGQGLQAFNYFGDPGRLKRFTMMRPTVLTNGSPLLQGAVNIDFDTSKPVSNLILTPTIYGTWDSAVWDQALWGPDLGISKSWQGATGVGYAGAPQLLSSTNGMQLQWVGTDVVFEGGAIL